MGGLFGCRVSRHWKSFLLLFSIVLTCVAAQENHGLAHEAVNKPRQAQAQVGAGKARWDQLHSNYLTNLRNSLQPNGQCTWDNMVVRREWGDMSIADRKKYIAALRCLKERPAWTNREQFPGVRGRWDDIAVAHLINTGTVHRSPWLAVWHRHYVWVVEQRLRDECGYDGGIPYWHWSRYLNQPVNTWPLFDNSETSISGNGTQTGPTCACVEYGPLANWTINLGPQEGATWGCKPNPRTDGRAYNPSCIERTFNLQYLEAVTYENVVYTVDQAPDANRFAQLLELEYPSVHNAPHLFMGGTQVDVTFSSQDPWFFFHHCMVDFLFTVWQSVDWWTRTSTLPDASIFDQARATGNFDNQASQPTLDSVIVLSDVFENITVWEAMWTHWGRYCYRYE